MPIDFGDTTPDDLGGFDTLEKGGPVLPGFYHAKVVDHEAQDDNEHIPNDTVTFLILAGEPGGQQGKQLKERIIHDSRWDDNLDEDKNKAKSAKTKRRAFALAKQLGIYTKADFDAGNPADFAKAVDKECIIKVINGKPNQKGDVWPQLDWFGIWPLNDPEVAHVPRGNAPGAKQQPAKATAQKSAARTTAATPTTTRQPAKATAAASPDNDDL